MIRFFDIVFSLLGILLLSPVFLLLYIAICLESKGGGFYKQLRVGRYGGDFYVYKFRSMRVGADKKGLITVGGSREKLRAEAEARKTVAKSLEQDGMRDLAALEDLVAALDAAPDEPDLYVPSITLQSKGITF